MLVLSRHKDESIMVGENVEVMIVDIRGNEVRLGITASRYIPVHRKEVYEAIHRKKAEKTKQIIVSYGERRELVKAVVVSKSQYQAIMLGHGFRSLKAVIKKVMLRMLGKKQREKDENKTRILIVDDHAIVRQGLIKLVEAEPDLMVCAEAENASQALEAIEKQQFDLAIVDILLEGVSGLELTEKMKLRCPNLIVVILSMHDGLLYAQRALRAGAVAYVTKYEAPEKIITAIRGVLSGKIYVSDSKAVKAMPDAASIGGDGQNTNKITGTSSCGKSEHKNSKGAQP